MDGPPPTDPSVLDQSSSNEIAVEQTETVLPVSVTTTQVPSRGAVVTTRQPQAHQLLSSAYNRNTVTSPPVPALRTAPTAMQQQHIPQPPQQVAPESDLFSLDFHAPTVAAPTTAPSQPRKDVKNDIMSLFAAAPAPAPIPVSAGFGAAAATAAWGGGYSTQVQAQPQVQPTTSMIGTGGAGAWGASSGWNAPPASAQPGNLWGTADNVSQGSLFNTNDIWGSTNASSGSGASPAQPKKDDVFGDLWGGSK